MKKMDYFFSALFIIAMVILYFFGTCRWDIWVLILGIVVTIVALAVWMLQGRKHKDLTEEFEELEDKLLQEEMEINQKTA